MADRRSLVEGLIAKPTEAEVAFVKNDPAKTVYPDPNVGKPPQKAPTQSRSPVSTRIRADFATALKRASLERQLAGQEPNTISDILEEALQPWLKNNGYLA